MDDINYVRLSTGQASPTAAGSTSTAARGFFFPDLKFNPDTKDGAVLESEDELALPQPKAPWWRLTTRNNRPGPGDPRHISSIAEQSAYLTLIPLSDSRLRPPRTKLIVGILLTLAAIAVTAVYVLVPRGVTVGTIKVHSSQISFNTSKSTYQILLTATMPVYNPNYLPVMLSGVMNVSFYDQQAGTTKIAPVRVEANAQPQIIHVPMDASQVPQKYLFTIYTQCFTFPEKLIFFLTASLQVQYLGSTFPLPLIDNYFILSCNQSGEDDEDDNRVIDHKSEPGSASWQQSRQSPLDDSSLPAQLDRRVQALRQKLARSVLIDAGG